MRKTISSGRVVWKSRLPRYLRFSRLKRRMPKIILIVRMRITVLSVICTSTGNYNDSTAAKLYTDLGSMMANDEFGSDASAFFIRSAATARAAVRISCAAPLGLREKIYAPIDNEIAMVRSGRDISSPSELAIDQPVIRGSRTRLRAAGVLLI